MNTRQPHSAYHVKEYANQWRKSITRNETYFLFFKNDSVLDYPRTLKKSINILGRLSFLFLFFLRKNNCPNHKRKSTKIPFATSYQVFLSCSFVSSLFLKQGCPLQHFQLHASFLKKQQEKSYITLIVG